MLKSIILGTLMVASAGVATAHSWQDGPGPMFGQADKDGDGAISRDEFRNSRAEHFARMDRNSDGYLDEADRRADTKPLREDAEANADRPDRGMGGKRMHKRMHEGMDHKGMLERLDADGDGKLSKDEFVNGAMPMFDKADTDGNGVLDAKELEAMKKAGKQRIRELRQERNKADGESGN